MRADNPMVVDCDRCPVRGTRCADCVVTALASLPVVVLSDGELPLDAGERRAVDRFVAAGLVSADVAGTLVARREPFTATPTGERAVG
ncbi:MAG TPA: hypothetical protein VI110_00570 [Lapillicoccus sp.]